MASVSLLPSSARSKRNRTALPSKYHGLLDSALSRYLLLSKPTANPCRRSTRTPLKEAKSFCRGQGRKGQTEGSPSQETHGTGNCKGYDMSVPGLSRQAAPTRIAFHSNPAAPCKGEVLGTGNPPLACKKFLDENDKAGRSAWNSTQYGSSKARVLGFCDSNARLLHG